MPRSPSSTTLQCIFVNPRIAHIVLSSQVGCTLDVFNRKGRLLVVVNLRLANDISNATIAVLLTSAICLFN